MLGHEIVAERRSRARSHKLQGTKRKRRTEGGIRNKDSRRRRRRIIDGKTKKKEEKATSSNRPFGVSKLDIVKSSPPAIGRVRPGSLSPSRWALWENSQHSQRERNESILSRFRLGRPTQIHQPQIPNHPGRARLCCIKTPILLNLIRLATFLPHPAQRKIIKKIKKITSAPWVCDSDTPSAQQHNLQQPWSMHCRFSHAACYFSRLPSLQRQTRMASKSRAMWIRFTTPSAAFPAMAVCFLRTSAAKTPQYDAKRRVRCR